MRTSWIQTGACETGLIKCREDIVCELDLCDGGAPHGRVPDREPRDALLAERRVEDAVRAELLFEVDAAPKHSAERNVLRVLERLFHQFQKNAQHHRNLSKDNSRVVCLHGHAHTVVDGSE